MKRLLILAGVALAVAALLAGGCGSSAGSTKLLEAHEWKVTKIATTPYGGSAQITLRFAAGKVTGSTGVNRFTATYEMGSGSSIQIAPGATTQMAGTVEAMRTEADFLKALGSVASYAADEDSLTLFDAGGQAVLTCAKVGTTP